MNQFKEMYQAAEAAGCMSFVKKMETLASSLAAQDVTNVVVTGMRSSGKTTFINRIVGSEVWEPGNMDDDEKPLRVCFEQMEEDERFQCIMAANREWYGQGAVIYELRQEDILPEGSLAEEMYLADVVYFMISANAPFNIDEVNFLKAMSPLDCRVVVNGIQYIREDEKQKVLDYISKINGSLGLPPVIVPQDGEDIGKIIRNSIPGYIEQKEFRDKRMRSLADHTLDQLEKSVKDEINRNASFRKSAEQDAVSSADTGRIKADSYTLRMDVEDCRLKAAKSVMDGMDAHLESMVRNAAKAVRQSGSYAEVQKIVEKEYDSAAQSAVEKLRDIFLADLQKINRSALLLALPGWDDGVVSELGNYAPRYAYQKSPQGASKVSVRMDAVSAGRGILSLESTKVLLGTGLVVGGFALAPLPTIVSWAGGVAAAGIGGASFMKKRQEENEAALAGNLKRAFGEGLKNIGSLVRESADFSYGKISRWLSECEKRLDTPKNDTEPYYEKEAYLKEMLEKCEQLRKNIHNTEEGAT